MNMCSLNKTDLSLILKKTAYLLPPSSAFSFLYDAFAKLLILTILCPFSQRIFRPYKHSLKSPLSSDDEEIVKSITSSFAGIDCCLLAVTDFAVHVLEGGALCASCK